MVSPVLGVEEGALLDETPRAQSVPERVISWYADNLNYGTIALLMTVESSFIPFPSEAVIPTAAYAACNPEHDSLHVSDSNFVNISLVVLAGTIGAMIGAFINYAVAYFLGRPVVNKFANSRFGHMCLIDQEKVEKAEKFFVKYGIASTLIGRLVPVVRQLISIPAGLAKMHLLPFSVFTFIGATIWNVVLAVVGYFAHGKQDLINEYARELSWSILAMTVLFVGFLVYKFIFSSKKK